MSEKNGVDQSGYDLLDLGRFPVKRYDIRSLACRKQAEFCEITLQHCLSGFMYVFLRIEEEGCTEGFNEEGMETPSL